MHQWTSPSLIDIMTCHLMAVKPLLEQMLAYCLSDQWNFNSLAPGRPGCHFKTAIFNLVLLIGIFTSSGDNALRWMPKDPTDDKSTLVQVMAWSRQATSHYLHQCWPRFLPPYGVTRPQWVYHCSNGFIEENAFENCCLTHRLWRVMEQDTGQLCKRATDMTKLIVDNHRPHDDFKAHIKQVLACGLETNQSWQRLIHHLTHSR